MLPRMMELVVVTFGGNRERAAAVLGELRSAAEPWTAQLHGACAVYRDRAGALAIDESFETTKGNDAIAGGFTGSLVGLLLAVMAAPVLAAAGPVVAGGALVAGVVGGELIGAHHRAAHFDAEARWWHEEVGVPDALAAQIRAALGPGDSAIVFLCRAPLDVAERFARFGGTVRTIALSPEQIAKVETRLRA